MRICGGRVFLTGVWEPQVYCPEKKRKRKKSQSLGGRVLLRIGANERTVRLSRRRATPTEGSGPVYYEIQPASYIGGVGFKESNEMSVITFR